MDRIPQLFGTRNELRLFRSLTELNDGLHVMANRYRDAEYTVWLLRGGRSMPPTLPIR